MNAVRLVVSLALALMLAGPAVAADDALARAEALYRDGAFEDAALAAAALGSADGFALAARATNVRAIYLSGGDKRRRLLAEAEALARRALARDPAHVEGALQLIVSLGEEARMMDAFQAFVGGLADEAGRLLDALAPAAEGNPYYHAVAGAWHGELVRRGGAFLAGALYGADLDQARAHFERALALAPDSALIPTEYAKLLLGLETDEARARMLLARAVASPSGDAHRELVRREATRLLADLDAAGGRAE
jgi:tetratricopeptide (TPR) repeat protein